MRGKGAVKLLVLLPLILLLVLMPLLGACAKEEATATPTATETPLEPILIGIAQDVTGFNADAGRAIRDAAILKIEEWNAKGGVNGRMIEYVFRDSGGDAAKATTVAREMVALGVDAVIGGTSSTDAMPEAQVFGPEQIPHIMDSAALILLEAGMGPDGKSYAFTMCGSNMQVGGAPMADMAAQGYKKIVTVASNVTWPLDLQQVARDAFAEKYTPEYGMEIVYEAAVDVKAINLVPEVAKIREMDADAILAIMYPANYKAWFLALAELDWRPPPVTYSYWVLLESVYRSSDPALFWGGRAILNVQPTKEEFIRLKGKMMARFGYEPVGHSAFSYDSTELLLRAMEAVGTDGAAVRDYLENNSAGMPLVTARPGAVSNFTLEKEHSLFVAEDYAFASIDETGKLVWE